MYLRDLKKKTKKKQILGNRNTIGLNIGSTSGSKTSAPYVQQEGKRRDDVRPLCWQITACAGRAREAGVVR